MGVDTKLQEGYKRTEVGVIPSDWEPTPLLLLSAFITKGATPTTYGFSWVNDGVLFLRSECVSERGLDLTQSMFITPEAHNVLKRSEVRAGDTLITITGNVGRAIYLSNDFGIANINQHIARIRVIDINVDANYVFHFLSQFTIRKYYASITTGQAYPQISLKQVRDTRVPIPPTKAEQTAIATVLSDVDALITSLDKLIAKKRDIKQATTQRLLTGRMRLPGFSEEWEVMKLEDVADKNVQWSITGGPFGSNLKTIDYVPDGVRIIQLQNIGDGVFHDDYKIYTSEEKADELISCNIYPGEIILSKMGDPIARACIVPEGARRYLMASDGIRLVVNKKRFDKRFVHDYINSIYFRKKAIEASTGSTRQRIGLEVLKKLPFVAPPLLEQQAIAAILSDMDAEIAVLEQKRDKTRALKQGMMQELLTGKTRLK